ncbi:MAG: VOC family protein [Acidimicrobiales bacterium]
MEVLSSRTIIHPGDLERSISFYRDGLGLGIAREFGAGSSRGVVFFSGGGLLEVVGGTGPSRPARRSSSSEPPMALWFQVGDIEAAIADISSRRVGVERGPVREPWGLIEAWIEDPDGIRIHLVEVPADHPLRRDPRTVGLP